MIRVALTILLPLLLPTGLYLVWVVYLDRAKPAGETARRIMPWGWLALSGAGLAALVLAAVLQLSGSRQGRYVPPHVEDGAVVPGHVVPDAPGKP